MNAIKLTTKQAKPIVKAAFPDYAGRKFKLEFTDAVLLTDVNWAGGSRNYYVGLKLNGETKALEPGAPWTHDLEGKRIALPADTLIVEHTYFCGHDLGITIYANPALAQRLLTD